MTDLRIPVINMRHDVDLFKFYKDGDQNYFRIEIKDFNYRTNFDYGLLVQKELFGDIGFFEFDL